MNENREKLQSENLEKRCDYLEWDEYFMAVTFLESKRDSQQVKDAAIILNSRKIIISMACSDCSKNEEDSHKHHAEFKALEKIKHGDVIYVTTFPCEKCANAIVDCGITQVIFYYSSTNSAKTEEIFRENKVTYRPFMTNKKKISFDFNQFLDS